MQDLRQRYAVIGDPIEHSLSPTIHAAFAKSCGIELYYDRMRVTEDSFSSDVNEFFAAGGLGLNVTTPLKSLAFDYADLITDRAMNAGSANTLKFLDNDTVVADNTDGEGLVEDLRRRNIRLHERRVLLLGAGGAARGCIEALTKEQPKALCVYNRTEANALSLIEHSKRLGVIELLRPEAQTAPFDVVINATSASLKGHRPELDHTLLQGAVCYDMAYGDNARPFTKWALASGAGAAFDGLGMLIEQAAVAFQYWHEIRPDTTPVRETLMAAQPRSR